MTPASTRKKGREYRFYRCVTRDKKGGQACAAQPVSAGAIESFVVERLREATANGNLAPRVAAKLTRRVERQRDSLLTERRELPSSIAKLSAEGRNLVESLGMVHGTARRLLGERIEAMGHQLGVYEQRLGEVERTLAHLEQVDIEVGWVAETLAQFDKVWDVMTVENRGRLMAALVERVAIDERSGEVTATLIDLESEAELEGVG